MSDDGLVPAPDSRAKNDSLLQEIVEAGSFLDSIGSLIADCLNPEGSECDAAELAKCRDRVEYLEEHRSDILDHLGQLRGRFQPDADGAANYSSELCNYLVWHLGEAMRLIVAEASASDEERPSLATQIKEVADKVVQAGTNPVELYRVPQLANYERFEQEKTHRDLHEFVADSKKRRFEWPTLKPYQSVLQSPATRGDLDASIRKLTDDVNDLKARSADRMLEEQFVPNNFQLGILKALNGRALKKTQLADELCGGEGTRLYRQGGIKQLMEHKLVANKARLGYYRPDAPPVQP